VTRIRAVWTNVRIRVRGDGGFGNPTLYEVSERLDAIDTYGPSTNAVLRRESDALLAEAVRLWDETRVSQRLFAGFWYQAGTWTVPRGVVVKAAANVQGTNRRFVTTNRPGARAYPEATYDEYVVRGESEKRNKAFKCGVAMDRLSDHRFMANYFRLYLHAAALNLLVRRAGRSPTHHRHPLEMCPWRHYRNPRGSATRSPVVATTRWAKVSRRRGVCS
jgi:hypothetical protein